VEDLEELKEVVTDIDAHISRLSQFGSMESPLSYDDDFVEAKIHLQKLDRTLTRALARAEQKALHTV